MKQEMIQRERNSVITDQNTNNRCEETVSWYEVVR